MTCHYQLLHVRGIIIDATLRVDSDDAGHFLQGSVRLDSMTFDFI